jgi:hypothetical protein
LNPPQASQFASDSSPILLIAIHTEEEFDWSKPFDRRCSAITHLRELGRAHEIFARESAMPTYLIDYPVASSIEGVSAVKAVSEGTEAAIGAHLHPWVTPPFVETVNVRNSYPGNLPPAVEKAKLGALTECIARNFERRPTTYLAGRYGFGPGTLSILQELGYRLDLSTVAMGDFRSDGGPDFRAWNSGWRWEGEPPILRLPHSAADTGLLCRNARRLFDAERSAALRRIHVPGMLARLGAVQRTRLTPEGFSLAALMQAARKLISAGVRILVFSFHSPSLAAGFTPYVRDNADRDELLYRIGGFIRFFKEEFGGRIGGPETVLAAATAPRKAPDA